MANSKVDGRMIRDARSSFALDEFVDSLRLIEIQAMINVLPSRRAVN